VVPTELDRGSEDEPAAVVEAVVIDEVAVVAGLLAMPSESTDTELRSCGRDCGWETDNPVVLLRLEGPNNVVAGTLADRRVETTSLSESEVARDGRRALEVSRERKKEINE
jgi:hypothetical protein